MGWLSHTQLTIVFVDFVFCSRVVSVGQTNLDVSGIAVAVIRIPTHQATVRDA
jgi:hypothetical protein